eukprot:4117031-Pyramimonas_sp.AAC.1
MYHRCRDGALLLQRHPIESKPHLGAICVITKSVASQIDKLEGAKVAETDYLDNRAALLARRASNLGHDPDPEVKAESVQEWQDAVEAARLRME